MEKFKIVSHEPKFRLSYTIPSSSRENDVRSAVQFTGYIDGTFLLGIKEGVRWSLDQVCFTPDSYFFVIEDYRRMVEFMVSADMMEGINIEKGSYLHVPTDYPLKCRWQTQQARGSTKIETQAYVYDKYSMNFGIFLKSAFQTIGQIKKMISEVSVIIPRLSPDALRCLRVISNQPLLQPRSQLMWHGESNARSLKQFLFLFDAFQQEFELLMTIGPEKICQMRDFINEWFDFFKLVKKGSSRTVGCVSIFNQGGRVLEISVAGLPSTRISTELKDPIPSDSVYINEVFRFLLMAVACIKFSEKDSAFISRVTREVFERK